MSNAICNDEILNNTNPVSPGTYIHLRCLWTLQGTPNSKLAVVGAVPRIRSAGVHHLTTSSIEHSAIKSPSPDTRGRSSVPPRCRRTLPHPHPLWSRPGRPSGGRLVWHYRPPTVGHLATPAAPQVRAPPPGALRAARRRSAASAATPSGWWWPGRGRPVAAGSQRAGSVASATPTCRPCSRPARWRRRWRRRCATPRAQLAGRRSWPPRRWAWRWRAVAPRSSANRSCCCDCRHRITRRWLAEATSTIQGRRWALETK